MIMNKEGFVFPSSCLGVAEVLKLGGDEKLAMKYLQRVLEYGLYHTGNEEEDSNILQALMISARHLVDILNRKEDYSDKRRQN